MLLVFHTSQRQSIALLCSRAASLQEFLEGSIFPASSACSWDWSAGEAPRITKRSLGLSVSPLFSLGFCAYVCVEQ